MSKWLDKILETMELLTKTFGNDDHNVSEDKTGRQEAKQAILNHIEKEVKQARWQEVRAMLNIPEPNRKELLTERLAELEGGQDE